MERVEFTMNCSVCKSSEHIVEVSTGGYECTKDGCNWSISKKAFEKEFMMALAKFHPILK